MAIDMAALRAKALANASRVIAEEKKNAEVPMVSSPVLSGTPKPSISSDSSSSLVVSTSSMSPASAASAISDDSVYLTPQQFSVVEKIEELKQMLLTNDPAMERLLKQIHTAVHKDPELVHFLKPEQIGAIVSGCMYVTKVVIVTTATKKATTASGKKLSQLTLDDI